MTAIVGPPPSRAPRCAAASMPRASPLTTTTPATARSHASCSATASPYGVGRREPTIATRGPGGGGHRPRERSSGRLVGLSGGGILQPVAERLEDVVLADRLGAFEVGRGPGDAPGAVEAASREALLLRPALERAARGRIQAGFAPKPRRPQQRVEAALPVELPPPGGHHPFPHRGRRFAGGLVREQGCRHPAHR